MAENKDLTGKLDSQPKPDAENNSSSDSSKREIHYRRADDHAMSKRETSLAAQEVLMRLREKNADMRDGDAHLRDQALFLREDVAATREETFEAKNAIRATLENHVSALRQANEHLVVTTIQAQIMTEEIQKAKDRMSHMAHHDFLTDLPNRALLKERLAQSIALAQRHDTKLAVLFVDLDRFKTINDSLGHAIGDALLQSVAQRLTASVRSTDTVSRQGGDEFVALLSEVADENAVSTFAQKMCEAVAAPYALAEQELHIGVTIGISIYPEDGTDADTLIRNADVAMYHAKNTRGNRWQFFRPEMNERVIERQRVEGDLYRALEQKQFALYYQAQVELQTGKIIGAEALIRWRHPVRGLLLPAVFMPVAEACGAIIPIGRWALREACEQTRAWLDAGLVLQVISVNISAIEFTEDDFFDNVCMVLRDTGLAANLLELELTETVLMKNADATMAMLQKLKTMGVRIAIDDFGTGYSSLSYLKQFPVDTLKIDQSFVAGIKTKEDDVLVHSVINLGKNLKHRVIAEGVETREQLAFLSKNKCTEGQGYYLSPPLVAEEFAVILKTGVLIDSSHPPGQ